MKFKIVAISIYTICIGFFTSVAFADTTSKETAQEPITQCGSLVEPCFAQSGVDQANCFYSAAKHPFCEGTKIGKLTYKRWAMSPMKFPGNEKPPAFLGDQLVDADCIASFDTQWSSQIINSEVSVDSLNALETELDKCTKKLPDELLRP